MLRVLVAPDKFKGSLPATEVARRLAAGLGKMGVDTDCVPVADGGDGTLEAVLTAGYTPRPTWVTGPLGNPVDAAWAHLGAGPGVRPGRSLGAVAAGGVGVVELARACGLVVSPRPFDAVRATSRGAGELLRAARKSGCGSIVLAVGGSASTDGGAGMLQALGVRLLDGDGRELGPGGDALRKLAAADPAGVPRDWHGVELVVASDVDNPLLGPNGAAAVYGPQKGASASDIAALEAGLARFAKVVARDVGVDATAVAGAGAAGGVGFGALSLLGARVCSGIDLVLDLVGFDERLVGADLVVTGEGCLDAQTVRGKAPAGVAAAARRAGVPVVAVAGVCELDDERLAEAGIGTVYSLSDLEPDAARSMRRAGPLLETIGARIAATLAETNEGFGRDPQPTGLSGDAAATDRSRP